MTRAKPPGLSLAVRRWQLIALCSGANVLEAALLLTLAPGRALSLSPQASALGSFGVFHDLRWLSVYSNSWWSAGAEIGGAIVVRAFLSALSVSWAWPSSIPAPSLARLWLRGAAAAAFSSLLLAPSVTVLFASAVVPVSWLFIAAVPAAVFVSIVVQPIAICGGWWRRAIPLRAVGWALLSFLVATVAGMTMAATAYRAPETISIAVLSGLFNAWAWQGTVRAVVDRPPAARVRPVVPVALAILVGGAVAGTLTGFSDARRAQPAVSESGPAGPAVGRSGESATLSTSREGLAALGGTSAIPVIILDGYGSRWPGMPEHPIPGPWNEIRFSYRGIGPTGAPLRYSSRDTVKPVPALARMLAAQVDLEWQRTGRAVDIVAESEGAVVAETYLHATPDAPVGTVLLVSPLFAWGQVSYPGAGASGWGQAGSLGMAALGSALQSSAPIDLSPQNRFLRSVVVDGRFLSRLASCPRSGVRQVGILALADAVGVPPRLNLSFPTVVLPYFHGGMLAQGDVDRLASRFLTDPTPRKDQLMQDLDSAVSFAASSWQVPGLPSSYFEPPAVVHDESSCGSVDSWLAAQVWGGGPD